MKCFINKCVYMLLIAMILSTICVFFIPTNKVYAAQGAKYNLTPDVDGLDDALYPGFKSRIKSLQASHPNYRILLYYTGLDWNEVLTAEYQGHGGSPINLFQLGGNYNGKWICPICGNRAYDNGSWCCASLDALAYMMDPRNSLNDSDIFQFKDLEGSDVQYDDIARVVSGYGAFINNGEAIQAIVDASNMYNINGYFLVAKIINEHGKNGSTLSNGQGYNGNYVGCYNYFNIGSFGNGAANIINNGLKAARDRGWTSIRASILGGAQVVKDSYITRYSQNTLYYQKFNVSGKALLNSHQYQQNIMAAQSQGSSLKAYYTNTNSVSSYTFIIPVFEGMPADPCARPDITQPSTLNYENGVVRNVKSSLKVRASAGGTPIGALNNNESIKIIKRAGEPVNEYFWDLIVSNQDGTYGYAARNIGGDECIASLGSTGNTSSTSSPAATPSQAPAQSTPAPNTPPYAGKYTLGADRIKFHPSMNVEDVYSIWARAKVTEKNGALKLNGALATGDKVEVDGKFYVVIKYGDVNGDTQINILDAVTMLNAIKDENAIDAYAKDAGCVKGGTNFDVTDIVTLLNYIRGEDNISVN
ncbi:MAG: hypothetical protein K6D97_08970 [Clostridia bacterium]|nr:hypothetical protein [Clostridia bacterium]